MKNLITRFFLFLLAVVSIAESAVFFMARYRYLSLKSVALFYKRFLQTPWMLDFTLGFAIGFLAVGIIFSYLAFRKTGRPKSIVVKDRNGILHIPVDTIKDFVDRALDILDQYSSLSDFETTIDKKGKCIYIYIVSTTGAVPIHREIHRIREALRAEIARVFEFPHFKVDFLIKGITVEQKAEVSGPQQDRKGEADSLLKQMSGSEVEEEPGNGEMVGDARLKETPHKVMPWE
ncbi:MAG: hypothetical protein V3S04_00865 [Candidatus Omnitrophota bacterium]